MPFKSDSVPFGLPLSKLITIPFFIVIGLFDVRPLCFYETSFVIAVMLWISVSLASVASLKDLFKLM